MRDRRNDTAGVRTSVPVARTVAMLIGMPVAILVAAAGGGWAMAAAGCAAAPSRVSAPSGGEAEADALDLGQDWIAELETSRRGGAGARPAGSGRVRSTYWGVILRTFANEGHARAAETMVKSSATIDPRLAAAHVHVTDRGSMVVYGMYDGPEALSAQHDLAWIKGLELGGTRVFPRAMLSRVTPPVAPAAVDPISLLAARRRFPGVDPLYTLQVAVWGDFESGELSLEEIRRWATLDARELRARGHEAYVHHDDDLRLSMITVGLFDHTAVDAESGLLAPEVDALLREFRAHLVNGEPLRELLDRRRPGLGTRVQAPRLVLVPRF